MKKNYEKPWFVILNFSPVDDIMSASGGDPAGDDVDWELTW